MQGVSPFAGASAVTIGRHRVGVPLAVVSCLVDGDGSGPAGRGPRAVLGWCGDFLCAVGLRRGGRGEREVGVAVGVAFLEAVIDGVDRA